MKFVILKTELEDLYENQKLTTYQIAEKYGCCQATIWKRLKEFSIKARSPNELRANIPSKETLETFYIQAKLSTWEIEKRFGFSRGTVHVKLKEYGIKRRSRAESHFLYPRKDFIGNSLEAAYLIGFRIGDLRVRKMYKNSETISVECGSTKEEQLELISGLFGKYVHIWVGRKNKRGAKNIIANLPLSFDFLLTKLAPERIFQVREEFFSFLAGFTDAEGNIRIDKDGVAVFQLGNCDKVLLERIKRSLTQFGIKASGLYLGRKKGSISSKGYPLNEDYWHLVVAKKSDLLKLLGALKPHIKHHAKIPVLEKAIESIERRNRLFGE